MQQVDLRTVRVTWEGIVEYEKCVDNYLVKYWQKSNPQGYNLTELIDKQQYTTDLIITPKVNYVFQVIAREDKGGLLGIDYNKSDQKEFKTSAYNSNVKPTTPKPAREPAVAPKATGTDNGNIVGPASDLQDEVVREENGGKLLAGFNIELIAIIIVCSIVLLLILVGLVYKLTCAKKTEDIDDDDDEDEHDDDGDDFEKERLDV